MKALDRKLLRDLLRMWSQALTVALVVASGVGGFITSLSAVDSLGAARDRYYADGRFADVFAEVRRAPNALAERLRELPGVADVQTALEEMVRVRAADSSDPIIGRLIGIDPRRPARMNLVSVSSGHGLGDRAASAHSDGSLEVLVSEGFAQARGLVPGARLEALINGKRRTLVVAGTALSPEYIFAGLWGMPDMRGFGVFWMDHDALAAAYDMQGAFTHVTVKLAPGAAQAVTIAGLERALAPYGGRAAQGRADQTSHAMLDNEIHEQRILGTLLPAIFLGVAAFLLNVVVSRIVATQREQIAALKALGYPNSTIASHFLKLVLLIVGVGYALGVFAGDRLGEMFTSLYAAAFHFPRFDHRIAPWLLLTSAAVALVTAAGGTLNAIVAAVRLPPAEAMRPPAPTVYRHTFTDRFALQRASPALRMVVRGMERRPLRTGLSILGVAAAVAIVVLGNFFRDAIEVVVDSQFTLAMRSDVAVWMMDPVDDRVRHDLARLPGVTQVEPTRFVSVTFVHGTRRERSLIRGYAGAAELYRVIDGAGHAVPLAGRGLVMSDRLAEKLGLRPGETVHAEILEGRQRTLDLVLASTVDEMMGLNAYMDRADLDRALGDGDLASGYVLAVERGREPALLDALQGLPGVAGAFSKATMLRNMQEITARNVRIMSTVLSVFAAIIAVGVVYNNARIALAERGWELASLRVLGFTRAEVSALLLGELAIVIAIALPLGMLLGFGLTHAVTALLQSDQFHFPAVVRARTYAWAAVCVLAAGVASALVVRRRVDALDMVAVLKTRE